MTVYSFRDDHTAHATPGHPERPARLEAIRAALNADAELATLLRLQGRPASRTALERIHPSAYLDLLEAFCERGGGDLDLDTYATASSYRIACEVCGDLLALTDAVLRGDERIRPRKTSRPPRSSHAGDGLLPALKRRHRGTARPGVGRRAGADPRHGRAPRQWHAGSVL